MGVDGEYKENKAICFSIMAIKKPMHIFLGIPLFNLLYLFNFDKMVNAWYRWYEDGKDSKRLGQMVGKL